MIRCWLRVDDEEEILFPTPTSKRVKVKPWMKMKAIGKTTQNKSYGDKKWKSCRKCNIPLICFMKYGIPWASIHSWVCWPFASIKQICEIIMMCVPPIHIWSCQNSWHRVVPKGQRYISKVVRMSDFQTTLNQLDPFQKNSLTGMNTTQVTPSFRLIQKGKGT